MIDYTQALDAKLRQYEQNMLYQKRIAGDISSFRYPHLNHLASKFEFDNRLGSFMLKPDVDVNAVISEITTNDITTYELLNQQAKQLHLYDFFGFKPSDEEKYDAFFSVQSDYCANKNNKSWNKPYKVEKYTVGDIKIRDDFEYLTTFINKSKGTPVYFYKFQDVDSMFQFGSTLKGTNIVIIDDNKANFYQELFHVIYHLEETVPGVNNDNLNIEEIWGNADALYLKQLLEGRLSRRIRKNVSPHDVKFLDYVFLRAYIGTAFAEDKEQLYFHCAFALIEPTMKLLFHCIDGDIKHKNKVIIDSICFDKADELKSAFNKKFGKNAYERVFYDFNLFNRLKTIQKLCQEKNIKYDDVLNIMFSNKHMVPTVLDSNSVRYIWENDSVNQNKDFIIGILEHFSKLAMQKTRNATPTNQRVR